MDAKLTRILLITMFFIEFFASFARGQVYTFKSLDGRKVSFNLSLNDEKQILSITGSYDTIYIRNAEYIKTVKVLSNNFLMVVYDVAVGSGMDSMNTIIISASNNKICQALNATTFFREEFLDFSRPSGSPMKVSVQSIYDVILSIKGHSTQDYQLNAKFHDERNSVHQLPGNYNYHGIASLKFDKSQKVFYSSYEYVSKNFTVFDPKTQNESNQFLKGTFPTAKFGKYKYYFVKGVWYQKTDPNYLSKSSYR